MLLLKLNLSLVSPAFIGSIDPNRIDPDNPIRPQMIKGVWRWWARAYVAGALFEKGCLNGASSRTEVRTINKVEVKRIFEIVGRRMGLGYTDPGGKESSASWYIIETMNQAPVKVRTATRYDNLGLQRITLLTLGRGGRQEYIDRGASFSLSIYLHPMFSKTALESPDGIKAALGSLLTSLILSGLGKGSRRGLGCLNIKILDGEYSKDYGWLNPTNPATVKRLINETRAHVNNLVEESCDERRSSIPPAPAISSLKISKELNIFNLFMLSRHNILNDLHNFFIRTERGRVLGGDPLRDELQAWVLGLPRTQRGTGYLIYSRETSRRASPLMLSIKGRNDLAYLSVYLSADWPNMLEWSDSQSQQILVDEKRLVNAYELAVKTFREYSIRKNIRWDRIWP